MKRGQISNALRQLKVLYHVDRLRYYVQSFKNRKANKDFKKQHPDVKLPPDYLIYESYRIHYEKYYVNGRTVAQSFIDLFEKHIELKDKNILDWGCGPGRIIRHLPSLIGNGCSYYGTDYNKRSIDWCSNNLSDIHFNLNTLEAKLPYADNFFDVIYGNSIFTHLSEQLHYDWYAELHRVLKPEGIMLQTTQGDNFIVKLTPAEDKAYANSELVVRGNVKEGHRTYSAFHPKGFMHSLFQNVEILEHIEVPSKDGKWLPQDKWIIKKK